MLAEYLPSVATQLRLSILQPQAPRQCGFEIAFQERTSSCAKAGDKIRVLMHGWIRVGAGRCNSARIKSGLTHLTEVRPVDKSPHNHILVYCAAVTVRQTWPHIPVSPPLDNLVRWCMCLLSLVPIAIGVLDCVMAMVGPGRLCDGCVLQMSVHNLGG